MQSHGNGFYLFFCFFTIYFVSCWHTHTQKCIQVTIFESCCLKHIHLPSGLEVNIPGQCSFNNSHGYCVRFKRKIPFLTKLLIYNIVFPYLVLIDTHCLYSKKNPALRLIILLHSVWLPYNCTVKPYLQESPLK